MNSFSEQQRPMIHLYLIKHQARQKRYLKNEIILKKKNPDSLNFIRYYSTSNFSVVGLLCGELVLVADSGELFERFQEVSLAVHLRFICVWRL